MDALREFFAVNRPIVLFAYGLTFFVMGMAIFLQSRRYSRLRLARDLRWLAAFGIIHGMNEWGDIFIPLQAEYLPLVYVELLIAVQVVLLALSFICLFMFGAVMLSGRWPWLPRLVVAAALVWALGFGITLQQSPSAESWRTLSNIWARYLLGLTGSLVAAYGLRSTIHTTVAPLGINYIYRTLQVVGYALVAYAVFGGLLGPAGPFFPAQVINRQLLDVHLGIPVEVFRSTIGLVLMVAIIRALELFEIELDRLIETMEIDSIQVAERERIGQEIHDGAMQAIYSASLILESAAPLTEKPEMQRRIEQARDVLNAANADLRSYMSSLRAEAASGPLLPQLRQLVQDPRFQGLLEISLRCPTEPRLLPAQSSQLLAIVQEGLSNAIRHGHARHAEIVIEVMDGKVRLELHDDGRGFDVAAVEPGYGLRSMCDRARLMGCELVIESQPGKGTTVRLETMEDRS